MAVESQSAEISQAPAVGEPSTTAEAPMVLHVRVVTGVGGGPEKTILNSPRHLEAHGYRSRLAYLHPPDDPGFDQIRSRSADLGAEVISVPDRGPLDGKVVRRLIRICRENRVRIWHAHDYKSNWLGLVVRRFWRCHLVTTAHGWTVLTGRMPLYVRLDRIALRYYPTIICVSDDLRDACVQCGIKASRCHVIYNAIDTEQFRRRAPVEEAKRRLGLATDELLVGAVGRLSPEKGFDALMTAVVRQRQSGRRVQLAIAGQGPEQPRLEQAITDRDCASYVRLMGYVGDTRPFYEAMDVFALSSVREGLPNVVLEAMAMEVPVVATAIAGVPGLVQDGVSGILVKPGDTDSLTRGLDQVLGDETLRERLRGAARERVTSQFSFHRRMEKVVAIYDQLLGRAPV